MVANNTTTSKINYMMRTGILGKESETLIYKETIGNHIATDICALLNTKGGLIVVKRGKTIDCSINSKFAKEKSKVLSYITTISGMDTGMYVKINPIIDDKKNWYIVIAVSDLSHIYNDSLTRYYYSVDEKFYRRNGSETIPFKAELEMRRLAHIYPIKQVRKNCDYYRIGKCAKDDYFYKYMGLETAILCIKGSTIRFNEPCNWNDKYEGHFYLANILGESSSEKNPITLACCLTNKENNEAAWKIYSYDAKGWNSHCVQFKINREKFREQLIKAIKDNYSLYEGVVSYKSESILYNLHLKSTNNGKPYYTPLFHCFFDKFDLESYLNLLLLKRDAFMHEQEVRMFIIPKENSQKVKGKFGPIDLAINWSEVIEEVWIDSKCTCLQKLVLEKILFKFGNNGKPIPQSLKEKLRPIPYNVYESERKKPSININVTPEE